MIVNSVKDISFSALFSKKKQAQKPAKNEHKEGKLELFLNSQALLNRSKVKFDSDIAPIILSDFEKDIIFNSASRHKITFFPHKLICEIDTKKQDEFIGNVLELGGYEERCSKKKSPQYMKNYIYEGNLSAFRLSGIQKNGESTEEAAVYDNYSHRCVVHCASKFKEEVNEFRISDADDLKEVFSRELSNYDTLESVSLYINN